MAKLKEDPITQNDLSEFVAGQDDFRLEISVFNCLKKFRAKVQHGGTYDDPATEISRQFDVRATIQRDNLFIHLAVECKNLRPHFPLLISTLPRTPEECYHEVVASHKLERDPSRSPLERNFDTLRATSPCSIYRKGEACGKSTTQVGRSRDDAFVNGDGEVYGKWSQAIASAHDLVSNSTNDYTHTEEPFAFSVIIPVLVTNDDVLWVTEYDNDGTSKNDPQAVDSAEVYLGKDLWLKGQFLNYTFSHLHLCTVSYFNEFIRKVTEENELWNTLFPIDHLLENL